MKLGAKIAKIRASLGETQEVFAKRFGKATSTIGGWEADLKVPRSKDLGTARKYNRGRINGNRCGDSVYNR